MATVDVRDVAGKVLRERELPVQVPVCPVSVWPSVGVPVIVGGEVLAGGMAVIAAV